ncbi:metallo-beta-lactamase superfamily protein [Coniochaeta ligniaria NRRL 30616]|uniref:Metallo-beta-lactamase superfamily protein n=1 Tax=Coniochaeta ligniaria NRRL 30616 TaxID=1408157 RepID=A0A1J7JFM3_9PEZI|nr:metallo-beta-lactamase superfamily protein [Coniochaeta ligniaria NRRL 30616]
MAVQLAPLPEVERLSPACIRIVGGNPGKFTLQGTNTYLLGTGPRRLLVDTGEGKPSWIAALRKTLAEEKAHVAKALITHWHHDHVQGIDDLLEYSPQTELHKNQHQQAPVVCPHDIADGQRFQVQGATLTAVHTPGHTVDHMSFVFEEEDAMFTGDNVLGHGTAVFEDLGTYLGSLEEMKTLFKGRAYPGHGPVIPDGPAKITEYIQHRRQREEQVVQTLRSKRSVAEVSADTDDANAWSPMELVRVIYQDVPETLYPAAAGGVVQILQKLEKDGKVAAEGERWRFNSRSPL